MSKAGQVSKQLRCGAGFTKTGWCSAAVDDSDKISIIRHKVTLTVTLVQFLIMMTYKKWVT